MQLLNPKGRDQLGEPRGRLAAGLAIPRFSAGAAGGRFRSFAELASPGRPRLAALLASLFRLRGLVAAGRGDSSSGFFALPGFSGLFCCCLVWGFQVNYDTKQVVQFLALPICRNGIENFQFFMRV